MPIFEKHEPGSFCWIELSTTQQDAAKEFYNRLFGWEPADFPMGPGEVYTMFKVDGKDVGACYTMRPEQRSQGIPPHWDLYIAVESADETASKVTAAGGKVLAPPFDVMTFGRMAVAQDPTGAVFCIWQAMSHIGVRLANENNTLCWADLSTPDVTRAVEFYSQVFGWKISAGENDASGYLHIENRGKMIGGVQPAQRHNPNTPPHWLLYLLVADVDATTEKLKELGGRVYLAPMSMENVGRMAVVTDGQGSVFALFKSAR